MKALFANKFYLGICSLFLFLFTGCKKMEFDKIASGAWNPNLAVPLANGNFGVYDILALTDSSDLVVINPATGAIALVYKGEIVSYDAATFVQIGNVNQQTNVSATDLGAVTTPSFSGTLTTSSSQNIPMTINSGVQLHTVKLKNGILSFNVSSDFKHDISMSIVFPDLKINGTPVARTVQLNYTGSIPVTTAVNINLTGAQGDFTLNNTTFNTLKANFSTTITGTGQEIIGNENISVDCNFNNLQFENATGYFGQQNLGISNDTILLKLFQTAIQGHFELVNPKVKFIVDNSFGFPVRINLNEIKTINVASAIEYPLTGYPPVFNVNAPTIMGNTAVSTLELNNGNTANLSTVISPVPKYFYFDANAQSNPTGPGASLNFITDQSKIRVRTEVELPLEGLAYGFELKDTVDFNFNEDVSIIESLMFRINVDNGFPVDFKTQVVFLDKNYNPLFTAFNSPQDVVKSASIDNLGVVSSHTKKITDTNLTPEQISQLRNVKYLLIHGVAQTLDATSGQIVKFFDYYNLKLKLAMQVQTKFGL